MDLLDPGLWIRTLRIILPLGLVVAFAAFGWARVRRAMRLPAAMAVLAVWVTVGRQPGLGDLPEIGSIADLARYTVIVPILLVALAAYTTRGRRSTPPILYAYMGLGLVGAVFVLGTEDRVEAAGLWLLWSALAFSAILTASTVNEEADLLRLLDGLVVGLAGAIAITMLSAALDPDTAFGAWNGRFKPAGANPNQIGEVYFITAPLALYLSTRAQGWRRTLLIALAIVAVALAYLTASRAAIAVIGISSFPLFVRQARRPAMAAMVVAGAVLISYLIVGTTETRLLSFPDGRTAGFSSSLQEIGERPLVGLLLTDGLQADSIGGGGSAHSAFLQLLYVGGAVLAVPFIVMAFVTLESAYTVVKRRFLLRFDPLLIEYLAALTVAIYIHGMLVNRIFHPTYVWAFLTVFVSALFIGWRGELIAERRVAGFLARNQRDWDTVLGIPSRRPGRRHREARREQAPAERSRTPT